MFALIFLYYSSYKKKLLKTAICHNQQREIGGQKMAGVRYQVLLLPGILVSGFSGVKKVFSKLNINFTLCLEQKSLDLVFRMHLLKYIWIYQKKYFLWPPGLVNQKKQEKTCAILKVIKFCNFIFYTIKMRGKKSLERALYAPTPPPLNRVKN